MSMSVNECSPEGSCAQGGGHPASVMGVDSQPLSSAQRVRLPLRSLRLAAGLSLPHEGVYSIELGHGHGHGHGMTLRGMA